MRTVRAIGAVAVLAMLATTAPAVAQSGSPLTAPANYPYHCDYRWAAGAFGPGGAQNYEPIFIGPSTCSIWQIGSTTQNSHLVPGKGTVTVARIKSGPNPAPVSIGTVRRFSGRNPADGTFSETCCQGVSQTAVINPTPNAVTEIPVNLLVDAQPFDPNTNRAGFHDIVVVNIHGTTGTLPMSDYGGPKPFGLTVPPGDPGAVWYFPKFDPSVHNLNQWMANGFEVLMNFDWCPGTAAAQLRAACPTPPPPPPPPPPGVPPGGTTPPAGTPPVQATIRSSKLLLEGSKVTVVARCATGTGKSCSGHVRLRTTSKTPKLLASRQVSIKDGRSENVRLTLKGKSLKLVKDRLGGSRKTSIKVRAEIDLGTAGRSTKVLKLRRK